MGMKTIMKLEDLTTIDQLADFLSDTHAVTFLVIRMIHTGTLVQPVIYLLCDCFLDYDILHMVEGRDYDCQFVIGHYIGDGCFIFVSGALFPQCLCNAEQKSVRTQCQSET